MYGTDTSTKLICCASSAKFFSLHTEEVTFQKLKSTLSKKTHMNTIYTFTPEIVSQIANVTEQLNCKDTPIPGFTSSKY